MKLLLICGTALTLVFFLSLSGCKRPASPKTTETPSPSPEKTAPSPSATATPTPVPTPTPIPSIPRKQMATARLFNGFRLETQLDAEPADETASVLRTIPESYSVQITVRTDLPKPAQSAEELARLNPKLPHLFTDFNLLMKSASVSENFQNFYGRKIQWMQTRLGRLDQLLSRVNFYDCETVLRWTHPVSGRKALLLQGNMDVNTDGSDGDRNVGSLDNSSIYYQPQTSYRWKKTTKRPNPILASTETALAAAKKELANKPTEARSTELKERIKYLTSTLYELRTYSFLVSTVDPFIVIPLSMIGDKAADGIRIGDYALVIHEKTLYPAIVGDAGPTFKFGEASLRIAQQIEPGSSGVNRPVTALTVSYLVFPNSAERPFTVPDLDHWRERCTELLAELGGSPVEIFSWPNLVKPWPTPTPTPTPTPSPTPALSPAVSTPSPTATPETPEAASSPEYPFVSPDAPKQTDPMDPVGSAGSAETPGP